jgi:high affinity sulfate transporter 1
MTTHCGERATMATTPGSGRPVTDGATNASGRRVGRLTRLTPAWLSGYDRRWLSGDVLAGVTLAAVAIPECMGYTSIARTPVITGLYTILLPTVVFALLGSSRMLVVGADSATAAILAAGLTAAAIPGLVPGSEQWLAYTSLVALLCAVLLLAARLLRLGFLGDFLSASVLVGFLTGVGVQVATGQIPGLLGVPKGTGTWLQQQWTWMTELGDVSWPTVAFGAATVGVVVACKRFAPRVPGAILAVAGGIAVSAAIDAQARGVSILGPVPSGFPTLGLPSGVDLQYLPALFGTALTCVVLIIAQSAATSASFARQHGQRVDINRDIVGLTASNAAAGLSGTFVVNGSPTKTQILEEQRGRTQLSNLTMSVVVLLVVLFFTGLLTDMPNAVLAGIVLLIGVDLIDVAGFRRILHRRRDEFVLAVITAVVVCAVGVQQGLVLAILLSLLLLVKRQYTPSRFVVGVDEGGQRVFSPARPGVETRPGLLVFRYDADLFYANVNRFVDDVEDLIAAAAHPVRWLVADVAPLDDIDYSAGLSLVQLIESLHRRGIRFAIAGADDTLLAALQSEKLMSRIDPALVFPDVPSAVAAFEAAPVEPAEPVEPPEGAGSRH